MTREINAESVRKPAMFAHFVLRVRDIAASIQWYETLLGMRMVHDGGSLAFMTYDDEHHRLALVQTPVTDDAPPGAPGLDHVAYTFESLEDLLGTYARLKVAGILPAWCVNHGPTTSMYYEDPDGNRVELQVDNYDTVEELNAWITTDAFKANPVGVVFDADKLSKRYLRGDPLEELLRQGAA